MEDKKELKLGEDICPRCGQKSLMVSSITNQPACVNCAWPLMDG